MIIVHGHDIICDNINDRCCQNIAGANFDLEHFDNFWIAWGFQVNCMHEPLI